MFNCEPDDPKIEDMDSIKKLWMLHNWIEDQKDDAELAKNHAYLLGSFINPDAVAKLRNEGARSYTSTDDEFNKSTEIVDRQLKMEKGKEGKKRKRKLASTQNKIA
jgi:hypothetical protein